MASVISSVVGKVKKVKTPIITGTITAVVYVFKIISSELFKCPAENYQVYGVLFIVGPAVIFFCASIILSKSLWKLVRGCCYMNDSERRSKLWKSSHYIYVALVPPLAWIMFVFLKEDFVVCALLGSRESQMRRALEVAQQKIPNSNEATEWAERKISHMFYEAGSYCQMIALGLLVLYAILALLLVTIKRCTLNRDYEEEYHIVKGDEAVALFRRMVGPMAKEDARNYVDGLFERYKDEEDMGKRVELVAQDLHADFPSKELHSTED